MVFDSLRMQALCQQVAQRPAAHHPLAVRLAQFPEVAGERVYIENLVAAAPAKAQARWIAGLTDSDDERHLPAWFEVMLFGWLSEIAQVTVEPSVEGNEPDFGMLVAGQQLFIEAKAVLKERSERDFDKRLSELMELLERIERPYIISIEEIQFGTFLKVEELVNRVETWLQTSPEAEYTYRDRWGNTVLFKAEPGEGFDSVSVIEPGRFLGINANDLKSGLKKKASQHPALREARYPYVLAFFLEGWTLSAKEFVRAWFGDTEYIVNVQTRTVVGQRLKPSGLHFHRNQIQHTSVSGTLVFQAEWSEALTRRELKAWYVQNPYARVPVDPAILPVRSRFVMLSQNEHSFQMGWQHPESERAPS